MSIYITKKDEMSAIVGYYRCGATLSQICVLTGRLSFDILKVVKDHLALRKEELIPTFDR